MSSQHRTSSKGLKGKAVAVATAVSALLLTGCSEQVSVGWLPTQRGVTDNADTIMDLWIGTWIAALAVGLVTWGLMLWCIIAYRRRKYETGYPRQVSYHAPLEIFYTAIPIILIVSFFTFSDRAEREITAPKSETADITIEVYGKQWAWDFNYLDENVYFAGVQARLDKEGNVGVEETLPTLYLPVNSTVDLQLKSRDVIHSFWIPAFLEKRDTIPGMTNHMYFTTGSEPARYQGKCAELCGEYHSEMLFNVEVVSQEDYDAYIQSLEDEGNIGRLGDEYNRNPNMNTNN
ncbi:cytochrome c oxidase subunit II [Rothia nasimurium]|uniref:cytochrome-c oxidase n=1 Tax=Rothia nasimurium TaxID=85336 RepID=A0A4Y9F667_9MICC|nr:cytochrome c oxidase subunit II [Rothia nasimurium]MBF0807852.1 cytochrome c oxidase subunit II [Rothia nasimurium]TFU23052.1 cytochrome c oxidase subunit II [Rothia nasimurium]